MKPQCSIKLNYIGRLVILFAISLVFQACNSSVADPVPTSTLAPTPTVTNTPVPPPLFDTTDLETYTHSTDRFLLQYPGSWEVIERPDGAIFLEPTNQAGYSVVFQDAGQSYTEEQLNQYLVTFVAQNFFSEEANFQPISQETASDGTVIAQFSSTDQNLGPTISQLQVSQQDTIVFVIHLSAPEEIWSTLSDQLQLLTDFFTPLNTDPEVATPEPTKEAEWVLIGPKSQEFGFFYADDWDILEQQENLVSVGEADTGMVFTASKFNWPNAAVDEQAAEKAAIEHIEELATAYDDVRSLSIQEFPVSDVNGATIDFLYTDDQDRQIAGSVITAVDKGKMHKIVFTAPADIYDAALIWFNSMQQSFTFLSPDEIETEEP